MDSFAARLRIDDLDDFARFRALIRALDKEYLADRAERAAARRTAEHAAQVAAAQSRRRRR